MSDNTLAMKRLTFKKPLNMYGFTFLIAQSSTRSTGWKVKYCEKAEQEDTDITKP